jgi:hypothetical protein
MCFNELVVYPILLNKVFERAIQESNVATYSDLLEGIQQFRSHY